LFDDGNTEKSQGKDRASAKEGFDKASSVLSDRRNTNRILPVLDSDNNSTSGTTKQGYHLCE